MRIYAVVCAVVIFAAVLTGSPDASAASTSTRSFSSQDRGSHPGTVAFDGSSITVDLSAVPAGAQVYRAILVPHRPGNTGSGPGAAYAHQPLRVEPADAPGKGLQTQPPRHLNLDCTAAVQRAVARPDRRLVLNVISFAGLGADGAEIRLDVWCDQPAAGRVEQVTGTRAVHRDGDTMITFAEVDPPLTDPEPTGAVFRDAVARLDDAAEVRYRIYRSSQPIGATTIRSAELVDEIPPLSGWNATYYGPQRDAQWSHLIVPRLPVADMTVAGVGTGIYVRRASVSGSAYYAVSRAVDGQEDLSTWTAGGNCTAGVVAEGPGAGMALQWKVDTPPYLMFVDHTTAYSFVRWECPPQTSNVPSVPHNYLVAVPPIAADPRPVDLKLHCWGGWMGDACTDWYEAEHGALLVMTNQFPFDWWTGYHENYGTIRPFPPVDGNGGGVVRGYTPRRLFAFLDEVVRTRWNVDDDRVLLSGFSMGGSGSSMLGLRSGDRFSHIVSAVGVHSPAHSPGYLDSFETVYGMASWACAYEDSGLDAFDWWDTARWLDGNVATDTPYISLANGKNDDRIGWSQAIRQVQALMQTRRPFSFTWGQQGHSQPVILPGPDRSKRYMGIRIDRNSTLPAFANCSLDDDPGDGKPDVGDPAGQINGWLIWEPAGAVDLPGRWEMTCGLLQDAPAETCTVDVIPRRSRLRPAPGVTCRWVNTDPATGEVVASGLVQADSYRLVTVAGVVIGKAGSRLTVCIVGDVDADGEVNLIDLLRLANSFYSHAGEPTYDPACDFNGDGVIDRADLLLLADNFGT